MPRYAVIDGSNTVANIVAADTAEDAVIASAMPNHSFIAVEISDEPGSLGIGAKWDGEKLYDPNPVVFEIIE